MNVTHRDIKPKNILMMQNGEIRLTDFGMGRQLLPEEPLDVSAGSPGYTSPELLMGLRSHDGRTDVFSAACVFAELFTRDPAFIPRPSETEQLDEIFTKLGRPHIETWLTFNDLTKKEVIPEGEYAAVPVSEAFPAIVDTPHAVEFISATLELYSVNRFTAQQALQHQYFGNLPEEVHTMRPNESVIMCDNMEIIEFLLGHRRC